MRQLHGSFLGKNSFQHSACLHLYGSLSGQAPRPEVELASFARACAHDWLGDCDLGMRQFDTTHCTLEEVWTFWSSPAHYSCASLLCQNAKRWQSVGLDHCCSWLAFSTSKSPHFLATRQSTRQTQLSATTKTAVSSQPCMWNDLHTVHFSTGRGSNWYVNFWAIKQAVRA